IQEELVRNAGSFTIYLAVPLWSLSSPNAFRPGQATDSSAKVIYGLREADRPDENTGENPKSVQVRMINARLILESQVRPDLDVLPVLRIQRAGERAKDQARLDRNFAPPSLTLSGSPTLQRIASELAAKVESSRNELAAVFARGSLGAGER